MADSLLLSVTRLGEETFFIVFGLVFFWCVNKKEGYYLLSIGLVGTVINQFLKLIFRIERPWIIDKNFSIVEKARNGATGYSFPSGHTQVSVGVYGGVAKWNKSRVIRIIFILLCVLVPFSRMYLGVHTPLDVGVSACIALILIFGLYRIFSEFFDNIKVMRIVFASILLLCVSYLLFVRFYHFPADIDQNNFESGLKNAYVMLGCIIGLWICYEIDFHYLKFDTKASIPAQILKVFFGLIPLVCIKSGLKAPLYALFSGSYFADTLRYFLTMVFAGCIWPLTFKYFKKLSFKRK
ncbi:MAG: phosphatase PAP2 family protein [Clostridia bacterium]|nr:phosphatase PAP2 family protein [Clostridia bacterium]